MRSRKNLPSSDAIARGAMNRCQARKAINHRYRGRSALADQNITSKRGYNAKYGEKPARANKNISSNRGSDFEYGRKSHQGQHRKQ